MVGRRGLMLREEIDRDNDVKTKEKWEENQFSEEKIFAGGKKSF